MSTGPCIHLFDAVALLSDLPALDLLAGEVGAVVEVLADGVFEVEFVDETGHTYGLHTLRADQLIALRTKGQPFRTSLKAA